MFPRVAKFMIPQGTRIGSEWLGWVNLAKYYHFLIPCGIPWSLTCRMPIIVSASKNDQIHHPPEHREPVPGTQMWPIWRAMVRDELMMKFHEVWHAARLESANLIWRHSSGLPESVPGSWPCPMSPLSFDLAILQLFIKNIAKIKLFPHFWKAFQSRKMERPKRSRSGPTDSGISPVIRPESGFFRKEHILNYLPNPTSPR